METHQKHIEVNDPFGQNDEAEAEAEAEADEADDEKSFLKALQLRWERLKISKPRNTRATCLILNLVMKYLPFEHFAIVHVAEVSDPYSAGQLGLSMYDVLVEILSPPVLLMKRQHTPNLQNCYQYKGFLPILPNAQ